MKLYRFRLHPLAPWRSRWHADTLAGMLCWVHARSAGPEALERDILQPARSDRPAFVLSDACPGDLLPLPRFAAQLPATISHDVRKRLKRSPWISREAFRHLQRGEPVRPEDIVGSPALRRSTQLRNVLNRATDTTAEGGTLFSVGEWQLDRTVEYLTVYARLRSDFVEQFTELLRELGEAGFGADASVGRGQFELHGEPEVDSELDTVAGSDSLIVVSTFQPGAADPTDGVWELFTKYGKLGPDYGVEDVFKRPLVMLRPGACFRDPVGRAFVGRAIPAQELLHPDTVRQLDAGGASVVQLAFGLAVPARWPAPAAPPGGGESEPTARAAGTRPEAVPVLVLLDVEGALPVDDLLAHLPPSRSADPPRIFRLSEFGGPRVDRLGPRPAPDWTGLRLALLAMLQAARDAGRERRAHFYVHGMAPLPVFSYVGLLLSAWSGPITVINRRPDGSVDICPMQGRRVGAEFFDAVTGIDTESPVSRSGRVIVFVSNGYLAEEDKLRLFVRSGGDGVAGLVQIRTSSRQVIDRDATIAAADELARHLSLIPSAYPYQTGVALVVAGPAQLALAAGRAVNPTIITDVWLANRGGDSPSGHELAFAVGTGPSTAEGRPATAHDQPSRVDELRLVGYRSFHRARLHLEDLTVLIGRNGAGKSTLLDAFAFLRESVTDSLRNALDRRGGLREMTTRSTDGDRARAASVGLAMVVGVPDRPPHDEDDRPTDSEPAERFVPWIYGFRVRAGFESGLQIEESLRTASGGEGYVRFDDRLRTGAADAAGVRPPRDGLVLPLVADAVPEWRVVLDAVSGLRAYSLSVERLRTPSSIGISSTMAGDGGGAPETVLQLESMAPDRDWVLRHLKAVCPGIVAVRVATVAGQRRLEIEQDLADESPGGAEAPPPVRFHAGEVSDGTLRALAVLLAMRQQPAPSLVLIDELEDSLHLDALNVLLDAADATRQDRCQVVLTSHSTDVLSHPVVTPDRTRLIEWRSGRSGIFNLDPASKEMATPPDSVGSILRVNGIYPAREPAAWDEEDLFEPELT